MSCSIFFFSSRRRHTRLVSDWSSDVCSSDLFQPVPVEAVAAAFVGSLGEPNCADQTYDLCGPEALTLSEIVDRILDVLQRRRLKVQVPLALARCQAVGLEFIYRRLLRRASPLNRDQLIMLQEDSVGNP